MAVNPRKKNSGTGRQPFRFGLEQQQPSTFDLRFVVADKLYRYGFKANDQRILEEWLVWVDGNREKELYERLTDEKGKVTIEARGLKAAGEKLTALATVGRPKNQTFLATISATLEPSDYGEELRDVLDWFKEGLRLVAPNAPCLISLGQLLANDREFLEFASAFLKSSSTGVDRITVEKEEIGEDRVRGLFPEEIVSEVLKDIEEKNLERLILGQENREILIERTDKNHFYLVTVQAGHRHEAGNIMPLELAEESDGTRRLLELIPALFHLPRSKSNAVFFIDEIDRSMHPMLVWKFLDFFLKFCEGGNRQIIVTTHESNLLDLELLRRDEIWFAEKDQTGATKLYSLADFKVRKDLEIRKHYLQGRFGAVPFLGDLDRLLEPEIEPVVS